MIYYTQTVTGHRTARLCDFVNLWTTQNTLSLDNHDKFSLGGKLKNFLVIYPENVLLLEVRFDRTYHHLGRESTMIKYKNIEKLRTNYKRK